MKSGQSRRRAAYPAAALGILLVLWEVLVRAAGIPSYVLPAPSRVLVALWTDRGTLLAHSAVTVLEALGGMGI